MHTHTQFGVYTHTYTHNGIVFSHAKEGNPDICNHMDLEGIVLHELSQIKKDKWHMVCCVCVI